MKFGRAAFPDELVGPKLRALKRQVPNKMRELYSSRIPAMVAKAESLRSDYEGLLTLIAELRKGTDHEECSQGFHIRDVTNSPRSMSFINGHFNLDFFADDGHLIFQDVLLRS